MLRAPRATAAAAAFLACGSAALAQGAGQGATPLEELTVQGQGGRGEGRAGGTAGVATNDGYVAKTTRSATKTDTPVHEVPATINTVTQKQIEDRRPQTLEEALAYTPGVRMGAYGFNPRFDSFLIRGVDVTYTGVFRDGLRQFSSPSGLFRMEPYGLESITVLKGGASSIYGASSSVGIIDVVSKRPKDYAFGEIEAQGGSWDRKQFAFDFGSPLSDEGTVSYRITGLGRDADTELPGVPDDRLFIAPSVTVRPTDDTKITLLAEYMDSKTGGSMFRTNRYDVLRDKNGNIIYSDVPDPDNPGGFLPQTGSYGAQKGLEYDPKFNGFRQKQGRIGYEFEHEFSDSVSIHQNFRYANIWTDERFGDAGLTYRGLVKEEFDSFAADTYLKTKLQTGPVEHTLLTGVDFGHLKYDSRIGYAFSPAPGVPVSGMPTLPQATTQRQKLWGVYVQDEMKLDAWRLLVSGRHDWLDSRYVVPDVPNPNNPAQLTNQVSKQNTGDWNGRVGVSYVFDNGFTPYVSYGTSFNANSGTVINGGVAKPTKGEQAEIGVKYDVPGYNASINASAFWLKQIDGIVYTVVGGTNIQTQLDFRNRGFEIEATASLANGWDVNAQYTYVDTKILKLSQYTNGNEINSIPKHSFSVWSGYEFKSGPLQGFGLGAGVRYSGSSFGDDYNRPVIKNKPRAFVDAKIGYEFEHIDPKLKGLGAQLNFTNLFDKVEQVCSGGYCYFNEGRKVIASVRYRW